MTQPPASEMAGVPRLVVLVGTCHTYQYPGNEGEAAFRNMIERICGQYEVRAIAEELSEEAMAENNVATSICKQIAGSLSISHHCVDPSRGQRRRLAIRQENEIRFVAHFSEQDEDAIQEAIRASHSARESLWLDQLLKLDIWPTLFVCGANHIESFSGTLKAKQLAMKIAHRDWAAE